MRERVTERNRKIDGEKDTCKGNEKGEVVQRGAGGGGKEGRVDISRRQIEGVK